MSDVEAVSAADGGADSLDRGWDALLRGEAGAGELEPGTAATVERLHALAGLDPGAAGRVWAGAMAGAGTAPGPIVVARPAVAAAGGPGAGRRGDPRRVGVVPGGSWWARVEFLVAAALLVAFFGGLAAGGWGLPGGDLVGTRAASAEAGATPTADVPAPTVPAGGTGQRGTETPAATGEG